LNASESLGPFGRPIAPLASNAPALVSSINVSTRMRPSPNVARARDG
jgi:hypothetical protein